MRWLVFLYSDGLPPSGEVHLKNIFTMLQTVMTATFEVGQVDLYSHLPCRLFWTDEPRPHYKPWSFILLSSLWQSSSLVCFV